MLLLLQGEDHERLRSACLLYLSKKVRGKDSSVEQNSWGIAELLKEFDLRYAQPLPPHNVSTWIGAQWC